MNTFDTILEQAEKLAGPGSHVSILVERDRHRERRLGAPGVASDQPLLSVKQAAEMLGRSDSTVRGWCRDKTLPATKIGRTWYVSRAALEELGDVAWRR